MTKRALIVGVTVLLTAGLASALSYASVGWIAPGVGRTISSFARSVPVPPSTAPATVEARGITMIHAKRESPKRLRVTQRVPAPQRGILARRKTVQQAVRRGVRPSAVAVAETGDHPAGLLVTGWGAAGAGFMDGDIITSVGGRTPTSVEDVIAAVAGAYRAETYVVSGRIWRAGETLNATVELPMPERRADRARSGSDQRGASRSTGGP